MRNQLLACGCLSCSRQTETGHDRTRLCVAVGQLNVSCWPEHSPGSLTASCLSSSCRAWICISSTGPCTACATAERFQSGPAAADVGCKEHDVCGRPQAWALLDSFSPVPRQDVLQRGNEHTRGQAGVRWTASLHLCFVFRPTGSHCSVWSVHLFRQTACRLLDQACCCLSRASACVGRSHMGTKQPPADRCRVTGGMAGGRPNAQRAEQEQQLLCGVDSEQRQVQVLPACSRALGQPVVTCCRALHCGAVSWSSNIMATRFLLRLP